MKTAAVRIAVFICALALAGAVFVLSLPLLVERVVLPALLADSPLTVEDLRVDRVTPFSAGAAFSLRDGQRPLLSVPRAELSFTPAALLNGRILALRLHKATLHLYVENGRLTPPRSGGRPADAASADAADPAHSPPALLLPVSVDSVELRDCRVVVHERSGDHHLGVTAMVRPELHESSAGHSLRAISGEAELSLAVTGSMSFGATLAESRLELAVDLDAGRPGGFGPPRPAALAGLDFDSCRARLRLNLDTGSRTVNGFDLRAGFAQFRLSRGALDLAGSGPSGAMRLTADGTPQAFSFALDGLHLRAPASAAAEIAGTGSYRDGSLRVKTTIDSRIQVLAGEAAAELPVLWDVAGAWSAAGPFSISAAGGFRPDRAAPILFGTTTVAADSLAMTAEISGAPGRIEAAATIDGGPLSITRDGLSVTVPEFSLAGAATRTGGRTEARLAGTAGLIELPGQRLQLADVRVDVPLGPGAPDEPGGEPGLVSVGAIRTGGKPLGSLTASLLRDGPGYTVDGRLTSLLDPGLAVRFDGSASLPGRTAELGWSVPRSPLTAASLDGLVDMPTGLSFTASIEGGGTLVFRDGGLAGTMAVSIFDGSLTSSEGPVSLTGLDCAIELPHLPDLRSSPSQRCETGEITVGTLVFDSADLTFRLEDPGTVFIEKSRLGWSGGTLESGSLRLARVNPEIDTTLYCSRLRLSDLLSQFGFQGTEGEGSVSGKLRVTLTRTSLLLDDGFLFSTPGTGGIVRFTSTDLLRQGMNDVDEAGYMAYALQALENFSYNWAKLSLDGSGDGLLMTLELDGKPATALPFALKQGTIVESGSGDGLQYPIRLDVNVRLPLADLFQLGRSVNSMMGSN